MELRVTLNMSGQVLDLLANTSSTSQSTKIITLAIAAFRAISDLLGFSQALKSSLSATKHPSSKSRLQRLTYSRIVKTLSALLFTRPKMRRHPKSSTSLRFNLSNRNMGRSRSASLGSLRPSHLWKMQECLQRWLPRKMLDRSDKTMCRSGSSKVSSYGGLWIVTPQIALISTAMREALKSSS